jgi:acyl carrier protein
MTTDTETTTVREILQAALNVPLDGIDNPSREEIETWDSLTHVEIMFMLEERFDVRFSEDEIPALRSLRDIVDLVAEKRAA